MNKTLHGALRNAPCNYFLEQRKPFTRNCRHPDCPALTIEITRNAWLPIELVDLVVHAYLRHLVGAELLEHRIYLANALPPTGVGRVDKVQY